MGADQPSNLQESGQIKQFHALKSTKKCARVWQILGLKSAKLQTPTSRSFLGPIGAWVAINKNGGSFHVDIRVIYMPSRNLIKAERLWNVEACIQWRMVMGNEGRSTIERRHFLLIQFIWLWCVPHTNRLLSWNRNWAALSFCNSLDNWFFSGRT